MVYNRKMIRVDVEMEDTVQKVKELVQDQWHIPVENQRLLWHCHALENERTLQEYKLEKECTLHLVLTRLKSTQRDGEDDGC